MMRWLSICSLAMGILGTASTTSMAENEPHPAKAWRPLTMVDLRLVGPTQLPTARLWHDRLGVPSRSQNAPLGATIGGQAAMAANLVIRSPETVVMLSILQVEGACEPSRLLKNSPLASRFVIHCICGLGVICDARAG